ncbi:MAG: Rrf2 family transcriptional regulator [Candidatus Cloacimonetes bacterium]|nr:Rrf2 family transcriptional regulator [Candidatus Cloacimonadota bacterium]
MYISTKTGYALRALVELALAGENEPLSLTELAQRQQLPFKYLEQLFRKLKKAELVLSRKGSRGGYLLARKKAEISMQDIMNAVEDSQQYSYCSIDKFDDDYCQGSGCGFRSLWDRIGTDLEHYFSGISLSEIVNKYV